MKILKRYYIFAFMIALVIGIFITDISRSKFAVIKTNENYVSADTEDSAENSGEAEKININTASKRLLMTLDGIGEKMAERIIEYRQENGNFETPEDIMKVSGIGRETFLKLEKYIKVE